MKKILLLSTFCVFIFTNLGEIYAQSYPKGIVSGQSFLQSASDGKAQTINITDFEGNKSVDTIVRQGYVCKDEKDKIFEIYKRKQWEKISSQSITLACPFRVFNINQKDYLIDVSGQSYQLQGENIKKTNMKPIQNMENSILIINKNTDELLLIPENKFLEKSSLSVKDKITKFSKKIKVNK